MSMYGCNFELQYMCTKQIIHTHFILKGWQSFAANFIRRKHKKGVTVVF